MNIQDLKDNREEIIEMINKEAVAGSLKKVMTYMVEMMNGGKYEHSDVMFLDSIVMEAIEDCGVAKYMQIENITRNQEIAEKELANQRRLIY